MSYTTPTTNYNSGVVNSYGTYGSAFGTYSGTSTSYVPTTLNLYCTVSVQVDQNERIIGWGANGNNAGCEQYVNAVKIKDSNSNYGGSLKQSTSPDPFDTCSNDGNCVNTSSY